MAELRIGVALLAAGASRRFGEEDKLAADFRGIPLGEHSARTIPLDLFACAWVVAPEGTMQWKARGFEPLSNPRASEGMGTSVALAARAALDERLDALVVALADMPLVPPEHFQALVASFSDSTSIVASAVGDTRMPPVIFGSAHFRALSNLTGDSGARTLLAEAQSVPCPPEWLVDIDTPEALQRYGQPRIGAPKPSSKGDT